MNTYTAKVISNKLENKVVVLYANHPKNLLIKKEWFGTQLKRATEGAIVTFKASVVGFRKGSEQNALVASDDFVICNIKSMYSAKDIEAADLSSVRPMTSVKESSVQDDAPIDL